MQKLLNVIIIVAFTAVAAVAAWHFAGPESLHQYTFQRTPPPPAPKETTVFFAGDIMLGRHVGEKIQESKDLNFPFKDVSADIKKADLSFANLESPFSDLPALSTSSFNFRARPETIQGLLDSGFDILSTANNHSFDQGEHGVLYTLDWLKKNNIVSLGSGTDCHAGRIIEKGGIKFGFLGYSYSSHNDAGAVADPLVCSFNDQTQIVKDVQALRPQVDFLIVSAHRGIEYTREPEDKTVSTAHAVIDAGADMFVGHHPHWIQTTEEYKGKYIFYSLGNFVFDQDWSVDTSEGLALLAKFSDGKLKQIDLRPVVLQNNCCPRWADDTETKTILQKINLTSPVILDKN
jgi:poly-gamma-glutamate synthesis protein (capsule biosynthesis protein)